MALSYRGKGTAVSGTGTISPAWPTHAEGDIGILLVETYDAAATLSTANGFTQFANAGTNYETHITAFYCVATSSAMSAPVVADNGDHAYGFIFVVRGAKTSASPINVYGTETNVPSGTINFSLGSVTTTVDGCMVFLVSGYAVDDATIGATATNANLTSLTEIHQEGHTDGNGGGIYLVRGTKATAGATGSSSIYMISVLSPPTSAAPCTRLVFAIEPAPTSTTTTYVPKGEISLVGYAPTVTAGGPATVYPPAGAMTLTGYPPVVGYSCVINVPCGTMALTGYKPTVTGGIWSRQTPDTQTWTEIE